MFGDKDKKTRKEARQLLGHAHKVVSYRRDLLTDDAIANITAKRDALETAYKNKAAEKELRATMDQVDRVLRKHGGKIYPVSFGSENVEMVIVAVILAIGIRTYFFQPFKIPTNSMWPTYAGLNATVYSPDEPRPNIVKRFFLGATQGLPQALPFGIAGQFNYFITAPASGELLIPVQFANSDIGPVVKPLAEGYETGLIGNIGKSIKKRFKLVVGGEMIDINAPGDFVIDDVYVQSWFPEQWEQGMNLTDVFLELQGRGMISQSNDRSVLLMRTGRMLQPGDTVLDFSINSGDMLFVDRFSYNFVRPDIGDSIVFRTDNIPGLRSEKDGIRRPDERYYIKRLVGEPGDTLAIDGAELFRNGEPIEGAEAFDLNAQQVEGYAGYQARWRLQEGMSDTVPDGYFYAMGDNSPHSYDSRGWGYGNVNLLTPEEKAADVPANMVPEDDVVGRAAFIFYPFSHRWGPAK